MEDEELEKTIDKISKIMLKLGSVDIYTYTYNESGRRYCQNRVNKAYDELFKLNKHLKFIKEKRKNEKGLV